MTLDSIAVDDSAAKAEAARAAANIRRLLARGSELELANGDIVTVIYTAKIFAAIEAEYGSLTTYMEVLERGTEGKLFTILAWTLGQVLKMPVDKVWDLIHTRSINEYSDALAAALLEAMPARDPSSGNGSGPTTAPSPGSDSSTPSSPNPSTSRRRPSGA